MVCDPPSKAGRQQAGSLNPYSTGIWSATHLKQGRIKWCAISLNPYFTGIWSATLDNGKAYDQDGKVLILILLEYGLRLSNDLYKAGLENGLNPYSTGIWSATRKNWCRIS